jgi:hypothetical protein
MSQLVSVVPETLLGTPSPSSAGVLRRQWVSGMFLVCWAEAGGLVLNLGSLWGFYGRAELGLSVPGGARLFFDFYR